MDPKVDLFIAKKTIEKAIPLKDIPFAKLFPWLGCCCSGKRKKKQSELWQRFQFGRRQLDPILCLGFEYFDYFWEMAAYFFIFLLFGLQGQLHNFLLAKFEQPYHEFQASGSPTPGKLSMKIAAASFCVHLWVSLAFLLILWARYRYSKIVHRAYLSRVAQPEDYAVFYRFPPSQIQMYMNKMYDRADPQSFGMQYQRKTELIIVNMLKKELDRLAASKGGIFKELRERNQDELFEVVSFSFMPRRLNIRKLYKRGQLLAKGKDPKGSFPKSEPLFVNGKLSKRFEPGTAQIVFANPYAAYIATVFFLKRQIGNEDSLIKVAKKSYTTHTTEPRDRLWENQTADINASMIALNFMLLVGGVLGYIKSQISKSDVQPLVDKVQNPLGNRMAQLMLPLIEVYIFKIMLTICKKVVRGLKFRSKDFANHRATFAVIVFGYASLVIKTEPSGDSKHDFFVLAKYLLLTFIAYPLLGQGFQLGKQRLRRLLDSKRAAAENRETCCKNLTEYQQVYGGLASDFNWSLILQQQFFHAYIVSSLWRTFYFASEAKSESTFKASELEDRSELPLLVMVVIGINYFIHRSWLAYYCNKPDPLYQDTWNQMQLVCLLTISQFLQFYKVYSSFNPNGFLDHQPMFRIFIFLMAVLGLAATVKVFFMVFWSRPQFDSYDQMEEVVVKPISYYDALSRAHRSYFVHQAHFLQSQLGIQVHKMRTYEKINSQMKEPIQEPWTKQFTDNPFYETLACQGYRKKLFYYQPWQLHALKKMNEKARKDEEAQLAEKAKKAKQAKSEQDSVDLSEHSSDVEVGLNQSQASSQKALLSSQSSQNGKSREDELLELSVPVLKYFNLPYYPGERLQQVINELNDI